MNYELIQQFIDYLDIERHYSKETIKNYHRDILAFLHFLEETGEASFVTVTIRDVKIYVSELYEKEYSRATMQRQMSSLRSFYRFLLQQNKVEENPFESVVIKKREKRLPQFFYEKEMDALFSACQGDEPLQQRNLALLELLYGTGMRVSECVNLTLEHIQCEQRILKVIGKGKKERYIPFNLKAKKAVERYIQEGRQALMKSEQHPYLFVNAKGHPLTDRGVRYILNQIIEKSALDAHIHPHELRHTFATHLLNHGADMRTVQELLGHVDLSSTQIYAHVTKESLQRCYRHCHPRA